jgi:two-component system sensor histidine kinase ChvG
MVRAIVSAVNKLRPQLRLPIGTLPLAWRILAVNLFAVAMMAAAFFYLDSFRTRLVDSRIVQLEQDMGFLQTALATTRPDGQLQLLQEFARAHEARIRVYGSSGPPLVDSNTLGEPAYQLRDPNAQPWNRKAARAMDRGIDWIVGAPTPSPFAEPVPDRAEAWPEIREALTRERKVANRYRMAPDLTPVFSVAHPARISIDGAERPVVLHLTTNARDITRTVRAERQRLGIVLAIVLLASVLLSLFLARTIVQPLRRLADAATRVRLGRAREVVVPRLPDRGDEIGLLARALSDMTGALRGRIDAGEHLAADIAHELKNPLASLRSALEGLERIEDPALRAQLFAIAHDDVLRLDRLISDIAEASRVDAELSRARFRPIDIGQMITPVLEARRARAKPGDAAIAFARPRVGAARIMGEPSRLVRVIENLLDNALSFSPPGGVVRIGATHAGGEVILRVEDDGPGVPEDQREMIFRRFHSVRPDGEAFGKHSGLGLAIARAIVEAHDGTIRAVDREDSAVGACFEVRLPAAADAE